MSKQALHVEGTDQHGNPVMLDVDPDSPEGNIIRSGATDGLRLASDDDGSVRLKRVAAEPDAAS